ncbi:MAG: hypothetical protein KFF50_17425 [Desulfatitalea sp.]|nr:hypothetical protein [Desulfatitalea sp.]
MIYYQSKYLSDRLNVNLAKWKRWSRAFLPPDPLGGLQSGIARQFNLKEVFKVYLGGYLVSELKFTIPEATKILTDLSAWLKVQGFFQLQPDNQNGNDPLASRQIIFIFETMTNGRFAYCIRTMHAAGAQDGQWRETYDRTLIHADDDPIHSGQALSAHLLAITALYEKVLNDLR